MIDKIDIKSLTLDELKLAFAEMDQPKYRAGQVYKWLHEAVESFDEMSNLPKQLRSALEEKYYINVPVAVRKQVSKLDGTIKYLWKLRDDTYIESVVMSYHHGNTICISSQVGCRMGCAFCASTLNGKVRDLEPSEMLDQVMFGQKDSGKKISNIVLMGTGEPLDNYDNVMKFLSLVNSSEGMNIGMRHISLSTCGLADRIDKLADRDLQLTLSVSLHAPNDEIRSAIMPVNRGFNVQRLIGSCRSYFEKTGRRISFEYAMIKDVNDSIENAAELVALLKGMPSHVNLIPLNNVDESPLKPSAPETVKAFQQYLESKGVTATVRRSLGGDIDAACGQLRRRHGA